VAAFIRRIKDSAWSADSHQTLEPINLLAFFIACSSSAGLAEVGHQAYESLFNALIPENVHSSSSRNCLGKLWIQALREQLRMGLGSSFGNIKPRISDVPLEAAPLP
jgi:hypothetical protein